MLDTFCVCDLVVSCAFVLGNTGDHCVTITKGCITLTGNAFTNHARTRDSIREVLGTMKCKVTNSTLGAHDYGWCMIASRITIKILNEGRERIPVKTG